MSQSPIQNVTLLKKKKGRRKKINAQSTSKNKLLKLFFSSNASQILPMAECIVPVQKLIHWPKRLNKHLAI